MKNIVLITRVNNEKVTHAAVYLCSNYQEAKLFCRFTNSITLEGGGKLIAREIFMNREYLLTRYIPFTFDDILTINNRMMQKTIRDLDSETLRLALKSAKKEIKEHFYKNMTKRAAAMLKEDIDDMDPVSESDIEEARQLILDTYSYLSIGIFDKSFYAFDKRKKKQNIRRCFGPETIEHHIILVFRGADNITDSVSVSLFEAYHDAYNFCNFLNELKQEKGRFIYARHAKQMVEYEVTKPLLIRFEQLLEPNRYFNEYHHNRIIRESLKKFRSDTLLKALKGLDKRSRELILQSLPIKTADEINERIENSDKNNSDLFTLSETRHARQKIIDAINRNVLKFEKGKFLKAEVISC